MSSTRLEALAAAALIAAAAGLLLMTMSFPFDSRIFPIMVIGAMLVAAIWWLVRSMLVARIGVHAASGTPASSGRRLLGAAAITAAYGIAVSLASYFIPTVIYIPAMAFVLGNRNLPVTIASGAGFAIMVYVVFVWLFERPIPLI